MGRGCVFVGLCTPGARAGSAGVYSSMITARAAGGSSRLCGVGAIIRLAIECGAGGRWRGFGISLGVVYCTLSRFVVWVFCSAK